MKGDENRYIALSKAGSLLSFKLKAPGTMSLFKVYQAKGDEKRQGEGGVIKSKKWASVVYGCPHVITPDLILVGFINQEI